MFDKRDRVIFDPGVKDVLEYAPLVKPGVFTVIDSNDRFSYIEDENKECTSVPNEILLKIPLYKAGEEIIVDCSRGRCTTPYYITDEMLNMNGNRYTVLAVFHNDYVPFGLGEDGCRYVLNYPHKFSWASIDFKKVLIEKDTDVSVDCIMEYVPNNTIIDDIKEQLKQINNQLKKEENENRLQEKRIPEPNGVSNYEGGIPSRAYKTRIAVCNLVHKTGIRGQKSKA